MKKESRTKKSFLNARVNLVCYFVALIVAFYSRNVFFEFLGAEFLGLTGTISGFLGFFNLAELGVGTAIAFLLYKPLYEGEEATINELISVFGYLYRIIGIFIFSVATIFSFFLPIFFPNTSFSWGVIYFVYFAAIFSSLLGYFVNFPQILLTADQRNYEVTGFYQLTIVLQTLAQIVLLYLFSNYYVYIALQIFFSIIYSIILYWRINKVYPWLKYNVKNGKALFRKYPDIKKNVKQIFVHTLGGFAHYQMMPILIYSYVSLPMVALYNNYTIIGGKISSFVTAIMGSTSAGVGNLIAEGNKKRILEVFEMLLGIDMVFAGITACCIFLFSSDFVSLWLGEQYIIEGKVVVLISLEYFLFILRSTLDQFLRGSGLYSDIWAPAVEVLLTLIISILGGKYYGLFGILLGPIISTLIIVYIWKPYFLFSRGFHISVLVYWGVLIKLLLAYAFCYLISYGVYSYIIKMLCVSNGWILFMIKAAIFASLLIILCLILISFVSKVFRELLFSNIKRALHKL